MGTRLVITYFALHINIYNWQTGFKTKPAPTLVNDCQTLVKVLILELDFVFFLLQEEDLTILSYKLKSICPCTNGPGDIWDWAWPKLSHFKIQVELDSGSKQNQVF